MDSVTLVADGDSAQEKKEQVEVKVISADSKDGIIYLGKSDQRDYVIKEYAGFAQADSIKKAEIKTRAFGEYDISQKIQES